MGKQLIRDFQTFFAPNCRAASGLVSVTATIVHAQDATGTETMEAQSCARPRITQCLRCPARLFPHGTRFRRPRRPTSCRPAQLSPHQSTRAISSTIRNRTTPLRRSLNLVCRIASVLRRNFKLEDFRGVSQIRAVSAEIRSRPGRFWNKIPLNSNPLCRIQVRHRSCSARRSDRHP